MSLRAICAECGEEAAYYPGRDDGTVSDEAVFKVGRVVGDMGFSYDKTEMPISAYLCEDCIKGKLPELFLVLLREEKATCHK